MQARAERPVIKHALGDALAVCIKADCSSPFELQPSSGPFVACPACGLKQCVACGTGVHHGISCGERQRRLAEEEPQADSATRQVTVTRYAAACANACLCLVVTCRVAGDCQDMQLRMCIQESVGWSSAYDDYFCRMLGR
jgi:hypothetical protein